MRKPLGLAAATGLLAAGVTFAHHSPAAYDITGRVIVEGTLVKVDLTNPHVYLTVETTHANGRRVLQQVESVSIASAQSTGLTRERLQRPVKLVLTREQVIRVVGGRTLSEQRVARGADRRGRLVALVHEGVTAATTHGRYPEQLTFPARHLYKSPALRVRQKVVNLDMVANTWMRAPGESIGSFALESALDELAHKLSLDPIELRRRNEPAWSDGGQALLQP